MRYFNTSGPCQPEKHYTVLRENLIAKGREMAAQGRYFTIFAPRQAGKTTYFQLLLRALEAEQIYTPFLYTHGVIDNVNGYVDIAVPLYSKVLITAFRPLINGEADEYFSAHETLNAYLRANGLNLPAILEKYRRYVRRRGFRAFDLEVFSLQPS